MELKPKDEQTTTLEFKNWLEADKFRPRIASSLTLRERVLTRFALMKESLLLRDSSPLLVDVRTTRLPNIEASINERIQELGQLEPNQTSLRGQIKEQELKTLREPVTISDKPHYVGIGTYLVLEAKKAASHQLPEDFS